MTTALVVIFNNPFARNINVLDKLYRSKFDRIFYLIDTPSTHPDIIEIKGHSYFFHNYYLQAIDKIRGYDYYFFIHDDAVLNPSFSADTAFTVFGLPKNAICIRSVKMISHDSTWPWAWRGVYDIVEKDSELRSALQLVKYKLVKRYEEQIMSSVLDGRDVLEWEKVVNNQSEILFGHGPNSDILMMPAEALDDMITCLQRLNFENLFVEAALPTAILLTRWDIFQLNSSSHPAVYYWNEETDENPFRCLIKMCKEKQVAIHPIKFGKFRRKNRIIFIILYLVLGSIYKARQFFLKS